MQPVLFMRRRSPYGPFFGKHSGVTGLSKSVGSFIGLNTGDVIGGWTGQYLCTPIVTNAVTNNGSNVTHNGELVTYNA